MISCTGVSISTATTSVRGTITSRATLSRNSKTLWMSSLVPSEGPPLGLRVLGERPLHLVERREREREARLAPGQEPHRARQRAEQGAQGAERDGQPERHRLAVARPDPARGRGHGQRDEPRRRGRPRPGRSIAGSAGRSAGPVEAGQHAGEEHREGAGHADA